MRTLSISAGVVLGICLGMWLFVSLVFANGELPVARTVPLAEVTAPVGSVVQYSETNDVYSVSVTPENSEVYGVVVERPVIILQTATSAVPVATRGVAQVRVDESGGVIARGDVLTTSSRAGIARRAEVETDAVFAIALEAWDGSGDEGLIWAEMGAERAQVVQQQRQVLQEMEGGGEAEERNYELWLRMALAVLIALGSLGFVLYSTRSIWLAGIGAIGRNPRAKNAVLVTAIGSTILLAGLVLLAVLIALAVLVLPV